MYKASVRSPAKSNFFAIENDSKRREYTVLYVSTDLFACLFTSHYIPFNLSFEWETSPKLISKLKDDLNLTLTSFNFRGPLSIPVYACYCLNHCRFIGVLYNCTGPKIIPGACFPKARKLFGPINQIWFLCIWKLRGLHVWNFLYEKNLCWHQQHVKPGCSKAN